MLFSERVNPSRPDAMIFPAKVLSMNDPLDTTCVTMPFSEANLKISRMSFLKNGSPPEKVRLNVPSQPFSFASTPFHSSAVSSCSSGLDVHRKHVGHSRLQR